MYWNGSSRIVYFAIIGLGIIEGTATAGEAFEKGVSNEVIEVVDETHSAELNNIPKANSSTTDLVK